MEQPDFSNPLVIIIGFFGVMMSSMIYFVKILPMVLGSGGILAGLGAFIGALFIWVKILTGEN